MSDGGNRRRAGAAARVQRLLGIVHEVGCGRGPTPAGLAERFGVSERRIYEDLNLLNRAGIRIAFVRGGYRMLRRGPTLPVSLTDDEVMALLHGAGAAGWAGKETLEAARRKLVKALSPAARQVFLRPGAFGAEARSSGADAKVLHQAYEAITERRVLRVTYEAASSGRGVRVVHPYAVIFRGTGWYLVVWAPARTGFRMFRLDRVEGLGATDERFEERAGIEIEEWIGSAWGIWMGGALNARLWVKPEAVGYVRSEARARGMKLRMRADGGGEVRIERGHPDEVAWWVMQWGGGVEVEEPAELRARVAKLALRVARAHGGAEALERGKSGTKRNS